MGLEREIKLEFDADKPIPGPADVTAAGEGVVSVLETRHLDAVYYDTADLRLTRWGCGLRYRSDEGWMVKLPDPAGRDGSGVLTRTEVRFGGADTSPPAEAVAVVVAFTRGQEVTPVAHLQTERRPVRVDDLDGEPIAELVTDVVDVQLPTGAGWRFHMVEIELAEGRCEIDVASIVDGYQRAGARSTSLSKLARALGEGALAAPDVVVPPVSGWPTAREVIHAAIARSVETHLLHLPIALGGEGTKGVHRARVALRRLRSDLRTFGPLLDPIWAAELSTEVRWLGDRLGEVRDADVRIEVLERVIGAEPSIDSDDAAALIALMRVERDQAHARLVEAAGTARCAALLDRLVEAAADPRTAPQADDPAEDSIPELVDRPWRKLRKAVGRLGPQASHTEIHHVRILAKRCRYAADAVEPVMGKPARRLATAMDRIQNSLGDLNDAIVVRAHLGDLAGQREDVSYVAGELSGLLVARAGHCEADFRRLWKHTRRLKLSKKGGR